MSPYNKWDYYTNYINSTSYVSSTTTTALYYDPWSSPPPKKKNGNIRKSVKTVPPPKPKFGDKVKRAFDLLLEPMKEPAAAPPRLFTPGGMEILPIGGAAPEAEIKRSVEKTDPQPGKMKITLERLVPVNRMKSGTKQDVHRGLVHLVRTLEGPDHLTRNIGIKVEPKDGSGHVEIPIEDLEKAIEDLKKG